MNIISNPVERLPQGEKRVASALLLEYDKESAVRLVEKISYYNIKELTEQ